MLERLTCVGLRLKPKKCFLFQKRVSYLSHVVTEKGITADPGKVEQVRAYIPEYSTEFKSFLGLASYYRRFIPDFSTIAPPLYKLTEVKTEFVCRVLAYPTKEEKFVLDTDASDHGV